MKTHSAFINSSLNTKGCSLISISKSPTQIGISEQVFTNKYTTIDSPIPSYAVSEMKLENIHEKTDEQKNSKPILVFSNQILEDIKGTIDEETRQTNK